MAKKVKSICIVADAYPTEKEPNNPFIEQLVLAFTRLGIKCTVLNPVSITNAIMHKKKLSPKKRKVSTENGEVEVISPRYLSFSSFKYGPINTNYFNLFLFRRSCIKVLNEISMDFDIVYGHFISPAGITANEIYKKFDIPAFFAYGENTNYTIDHFGVFKTKKMLRDIKGVIAVSTANQYNLIDQDIIEESKIEVFPNSIDNKLFYMRDKKGMRKKYGLPEEEFIVAFVGRFIETKGANRLSQAIETIGSDKIKSIFIGYGNVRPTCGGILYEGQQQHENIAELLSAADVFVLPTLAEGSCNAIIEAMACGLPIVSSNKRFNEDILDETNSLKVEPTNINEIAEAIKALYYNDNLREKLSEGSLKKAKTLNIDERAKNIVSFIEKKLVANELEK